MHYPLGDTEYYVYDGGQVIAEYEDDVLVRKFIYGPDIDEPIMMIDVDDNNKVYYYHFDGLGSVIALSDGVGNVVERCSYDVFGEPNRTSSVGNPYMFTGRRYDSETALYYYRARYYKPAIGRFLQTDPIPALNLYTYCGNNPINWIDPLGLCKESKLVVITNSDLNEAILNFYNEKLRGKTEFTINDWIGADTKYRSMRQRLIYNGRAYSADQVNYIAIGAALRHLKKHPLTIVFYPHLWNRFLITHKHWATEGEIYFTKYGYWAYDRVVHGVDFPAHRSVRIRSSHGRDY